MIGGFTHHCDIVDFRDAAYECVHLHYCGPVASWCRVRAAWLRLVLSCEQLAFARLRWAECDEYSAEGGPREAVATARPAAQAAVWLQAGRPLLLI